VTDERDGCPALKTHLTRTGVMPPAQVRVVLAQVLQIRLNPSSQVQICAIARVAITLMSRLFKLGNTHLPIHLPLSIQGIIVSLQPGKVRSAIANF